MDSRLSFLFSHSTDIFCVVDMKSNFVHANHAFRHISGYDGEELIGKSIADFYHRADKTRNDDILKGLPIKKNIEGFETRLKSKSGRFFNMLWSLSYSERDQLIYAVGVCIPDKIHGRNKNNVAVKMQHVITSLNEGFFMLDKNWRITAFNPAFQAIIGQSGNGLEGMDFRSLDSLAITGEVMREFEEAFKNNRSSQVQYYDQHYKGWLRLNIYPYKGEVTAFIRDISNVKMQQLVLALEKNVLELNILPEYTLPQVVNELLKGIEAIFPEMYCSVLEIDNAQQKMHHMAAPRLPAAYCDAIDGTTIGPNTGSCGTAAYHRTLIIVSDIEHDPLWKDYKYLILPHGFKACWSTPIISFQSKKVLATFGIYYTTVREPKADELRMIERTVNILRLLIESKRNATHLEEQNKRLYDIAQISSHDIRRPVASIMGLVNLFDKNKPQNPLNSEIIDHLKSTSMELDNVIHMIIEKTSSI